MTYDEPFARTTHMPVCLHWQIGAPARAPSWLHALQPRFCPMVHPMSSACWRVLELHMRAVLCTLRHPRRARPHAAHRISRVTGFLFLSPMAAGTPAAPASQQASNPSLQLVPTSASSRRYGSGAHRGARQQTNGTKRNIHCNTILAHPAAPARSVLWVGCVSASQWQRRQLALALLATVVEGLGSRRSISWLVRTGASQGH